MKDFDKVLTFSTGQKLPDKHAQDDTAITVIKARSAMKQQTEETNVELGLIMSVQI